MTGISLTLTITDAEIVGALRGIQARAEDMTPVMTDIGGVLEASTVLRFATNLAPDGTPWATSKRAEATGTPTLVQHGHLRDSIHFVAYQDAVEVGSNLIYAGVHQVGATITAKGEALHFEMWGGGFVTAKSVQIPKREYLGLSDNDNREIIDVVGDHLTRAAQGGR